VSQDYKPNCWERCCRDCTCGSLTQNLGLRGCPALNVRCQASKGSITCDAGPPYRPKCRFFMSKATPAKKK